MSLSIHMPASVSFPSTPSAPSSPSSSKHSSRSPHRSTSPSHSRRKSSLCLNQPIVIPVPPGLLSSPHLHAQSMLPKYPAAHVPSQKDEDWLGDTIPISTNGMHDDDARGVLGKKGQSDIIGSKGMADGRNNWIREERSGRPTAPTRKISTTSPPLVHWRAQHPPSSFHPEEQHH
ncbi:hypothetical protein NEOLEDRAFT_1239521 [Neolentinus lepideus HHB14362 ss-1]|uniref:Uncharacterized protein n=1 Tax=Neolentinus lepideus HHB14362 ss-1 TaxID=1314782 RepID=A0A165UR28_9AGAM|nr:hypothetical protein NEOLEDRAFT_1239521 [Neolentinus lepideus HHB14362 ss-1]